MNNLFIKLKHYGLFKFLRFAFSEVYRLTWVQWARNSYSQKWEDVLIDALLGNKRRGFYIDVGANDPTRFSNTKRFYKKGWEGINIEPNTDLFEKLKGKRPKDINLNVGIGVKNKSLTFYKFMPDTLSTFSKESARRFQRLGYALVSKEKIEIKRLRDVLHNYAKGRIIDFISVDTEGFDMEVLRSNDWLKFRPKILCVESVKIDVKSSSKVNKTEFYLRRKGYEEYYDNGINTIFIDKNSKIRLPRKKPLS